VNAKQVLERAAQIKAEAGAIQELWQSLLPELDFTPDLRQCKVWIVMYGFDNAAEALERLPVWLQQFDAKNEKRIADGEEPLRARTENDIIHYASKCMVNLKNGVQPNHAERGNLL